MNSGPDTTRLQASVPTFLARVHSVRRGLFVVLEGIVFVLVIVILALVFTQVFTRYVLHVPVNWLEEAARMALVWLVMLGAAIAAERREHYVIDIVVQRVPRQLALSTLLLTNLLGIAFLVVLVVTGALYFKSSMSNFYVSLNVPRGYIYIAVPIGALLMAFSLLSQSLEAWLTGTAPTSAVVSTPESDVALLPHE